MVWRIWLQGPYLLSISLAESVAYRTWFNPRLGQYSIQEFMTVFATGNIPLSSLSFVSTLVMWEGSKWLGKNIVKYWFKELVHWPLEMTEILMKIVLNTIQAYSDNHSQSFLVFFFKIL